MRILYIMNNGKKYESMQPIGYILCKKDNGIILKNTIINTMIFNNQHVSPSNIYITCDPNVLVLFPYKEYLSPHWCIKCKSSSKNQKVSNNYMGDEWII